MIKYTELKEDNRHDLRKEIPLVKPYTLLIEPSNYCNFNCVQCFQSLKQENYLTKNRGSMSLELYRDIMRQMREWEGPKLKVLKLSLYGEPFVCPDFGEMLRMAKEADIAERIETTTNMSLLTPKLCRELVEYEIDYIRVSIYAGNQERYRKITGCSTVDIEHIIHQLQSIQDMKRALKKEKPFVSAKMLDTFTEENAEFLGRFSPVADEVYIDKPHNWIATDEKSFIDSLYEEQGEELLKRLESTLSDRIACTMPFTTLAIRSNGDVSPCCIDWAGETNIGNVREESIRDIWEGDRLYEFRKMQLEDRKCENKSCKNCEFYRNDYYIRDNIDGFPVEKLRRSGQGV